MTQLKNSTYNLGGTLQHSNTSWLAKIGADCQHFILSSARAALPSLAAYLNCTFVPHASTVTNKYFCKFSNIICRYSKYFYARPFTGQHAMRYDGDGRWNGCVTFSLADPGWVGTVTRWMCPECGCSEESGVRTGLGALTVGQPSPALFSIHDDGQFLLLILLIL